MSPVAGVPRRAAALALLVAAGLAGCASRGQAAPSASDRAALDYRVAAARHVYERHLDLIHDGKLPPLLHAVAAIRTTVDARGRVTAIQVTRRPAAAPEVPAWIERMIRAAEPFPKPPSGLRSISYPEVWLVTDRGRFQLHTLSEGQAGEDDEPAR